MSRRPSPIARFFGFAMIAVGALITLLSGACTLAGLYFGIIDRGSHGMVPTALIFGLPFVAIGVGLVVGGRSLSRNPRPGQPPDQVF